MNLSEKQALFVKLALSGKNIFLTGKAGTGKSFVVNRVKELLTKSGKNVIALAPTGIAANNIGGQTIHSFFSLNPFGVLSFQECRFFKSEKRRLIDKIDVILIDEVSMLRPDLLDAIHWTMIKNGCPGLNKVQLIFIGDLKQLPAPVDDNMRSVLLSIYNGTEFYDAKVYSSLEVKTIELDEVLRQNDEDFINALNAVREGGKSEYFRQFVGKDKRGVILAPHNTTVNEYNLNGLKEQSGDEYTFNAIVTGNLKAGDFNLESKVSVKDGCSIMYLANSKNNNLFNGSVGIYRRIEGKDFIEIKGCRHSLETVEFSKKEYALSDDEQRLELKEIGSIKQIPIKLAYALTIHKSQGMSFDYVTIDLSLPCFQRGQLYVALSRVRTPQGLTIITNRI